MKDKKILIILLMFIVLCSVFLCTGIDEGYESSTKIKVNNARMMNDEWVYNGQKIALPQNIDVPKETKVSISRDLPYIIGDNEYLCILSAEQSIEVYINEELVYRSGYDLYSRIIDMPGDIYNIVKLPERTFGKRITINYTSKYKKHASELNGIYYGTKGDIILNILQHGIYKIIICLLLKIGAIVCFIYMLVYRRKRKAKNFIHLGIFCMIVSEWVFLESGLTQFIFNDQHLVKIGSYFCIMLSPIAMNLLVKNIIGRCYNKISRIFVHAYIINFIVEFILAVSNTSAFHSVLIFTHILIFINSVVAFYIMANSLRKHKNKINQYILICMSPIIIAAILEIIMYYRKTYIFDTSKSFVIGITISMIFAAILILADVISAYKKAKDAKLLNMLAFQDTITKGKNRTAFYRDINMMSEYKNDNLCIIVLDMNNLKKVNDKYGHMAGDDAIRLCYHCIIDSIPDENTGSCYRIGGDEFTCIFNNYNKNQIEQFLRLFKSRVDYSSEKVNYDFNVAYGYAFYDKKIDNSLMDTFNRADKLMYIRKKSMKEINN